MPLELTLRVHTVAGFSIIATVALVLSVVLPTGSPHTPSLLQDDASHAAQKAMYEAVRAGKAAAAARKKVEMLMVQDVDR